MVIFKRWLVHLFMLPWRWRRAFPPATLKAIEQAVARSETQHRGELRFVVENALPPSQVWRGMSARQRAIELFVELGIWDTEDNSGVLIYLLLADREVHIVADRGINRRVAQFEWDAIADTMQSHFRAGEFELGVLTGIDRITELLAAYFPAEATNDNELADAPVII